jgi:ribosomal protein L37E
MGNGTKPEGLRKKFMNYAIRCNVFGRNSFYWKTTTGMMRNFELTKDRRSLAFPSPNSKKVYVLNDLRSSSGAKYTKCTLNKITTVKSKAKLCLSLFICPSQINHLCSVLNNVFTEYKIFLRNFYLL